MKVFNRGALSISFSVRGRNVIIEGRNSSIILNSIEKVTEISDSDWEYIKNKYSYIYEIAENIIFANPKMENIKAQAKELEKEILVDMPLTEEDINKKSKKG